MSFDSYQRKTIKTKRIPLLASVIVLCLTLSLVVVINRIQNNNHHAVLESAASRQADLLRDQINSDIDFIGSAANFFQSSAPSNWINFDRFAKEVVRSSNSLMSLQWLEKVTSKNYKQYVLKQKYSYPDFRVYTLNDDKEYPFNGEFKGSSALYVVSDIYPISRHNLDILGFYSDSTRTQSFIHNIKTTKQPNVSDSVTILADTLESIKVNGTSLYKVTRVTHANKEKRGLLIFYPVFTNDGKVMKGVVVGVVDLTVYMNSIIHRSLNGIYSQIKIIDTGIGSTDSPVMYKSKNWDTTDGTTLVRKVTLPNRVWLVEFKQSNAKREQDLWVLIGITLAGVIIALLVYYIVSFQRGEKERIEAQLKIKTKELQFLVNRDVLTKLRNRRSFNQYIDELVASKQAFTLIGIDVDKFKSINDEFGHVFGDQALIHVAQIVPTLLQPEDKFYRLGGDEFCIITKQTDSGYLEAILSAMCLKVNQTILQYKGNKTYCSLSIGAAILREDDDVESIMTRTDSALYKSKKKGRNCFSILH
ncbi:sensor domain-containing diguanylate cyclase [Photobacterium leiognathi]|uniref:sensor domain-containing diguanylate cyclase n=1 Tax=Photobacterium leiognathi TaxID=553611 RepID=UPI00076A8F07|nr:sensor domain-containing diguanylate cyclase [Photobacterium leiognathi]